jgi:uncharacterized protein YlzI (FlbEa/FlbD family)
MGEIDKVHEDLGPYLFGVCGVPKVVKREVLISHEHRDEVPDPGELLRKYPDVTVHMSRETLAVLRGKAGIQVVPAAFKVNFRDRFKVYLTDYMWYGRAWDVDGILMFRIEHNSPDPSFRSHVAFGFAKRKLYCYFSEATGKFLMEYGEQIIRQVEPKYVVASPPSYMHKLSVEHLAKFKRTIESLSAMPLMVASFINGEKLLWSEEVEVQPNGFIVLPKQVKSMFDTYGPI